MVMSTAASSWATASPTPATSAAPIVTVTPAVWAAITAATRRIVASGVVAGGKILWGRSIRFGLTLIEVRNFRFVRLLHGGSSRGFFAFAKFCGVILVDSGFLG